MEDELGVALHSNGGAKPSEELERQISETRERFRESLAAEASRRRS
jgi:hypothetical protein